MLNLGHSSLNQDSTGRNSMESKFNSTGGRQINEKPYMTSTGFRTLLNVLYDIYFAPGRFYITKRKNIYFVTNANEILSGQMIA